jgi:hypothetical protein
MSYTPAEIYLYVKEMARVEKDEGAQSAYQDVLDRLDRCSLTERDVEELAAVMFPAKRSDE